MKKKGNSLLTNGIILIAAACYLIWYFTSKGMWNFATVLVLILILAIAAGQILIYLFFFKDKTPPKSGRKAKK